MKISLGFWYMSKEQTPPESCMWEKDFPVVVVTVGPGCRQVNTVTFRLIQFASLFCDSTSFIPRVNTKQSQLCSYS